MGVCNKHDKERKEETETKQKTDRRPKGLRYIIRRGPSLSSQLTLLSAVADA